MSNPTTPLAILVRATADKLRAENIRNDLPSLLIMPVQRIPRYRLLLNELLSATMLDNADHVALSRALTLVAKIAETVNASIAARANRDKVFFWLIVCFVALVHH